MSEKFTITTAIDYTNGPPHIGHAYEKILADAIARHRRIKGDDVFFLTGVDQHGQKVQQSAGKQGVEPAEFVAGIEKLFIDLWKRLDVHYDRWAATVDDVHKTCVRGMLQRLWDEGQFYKTRQSGHYSVRQEQFLTDKERGPDGEFGEEWGEVVVLEEENYYFKLARHRDWLLELIDKRSAAGDPLVVPPFRVAELRNAAEKISGDLCISRPKSRLTWGIDLPFDSDYVTYVWFDALSNYISFTGYDPTPGAAMPEFRSRWPALQVIGKDILAPPHGIYWLIMLHALGFADEDMPTLLVHGWWNISGAKMSKSLGNIVDPSELVDRYGCAAVRYYLLADIATGRDADFSLERLVQRYNTELANGLGNLLNRSLNMAGRYRGGVVKRSPSVLAEFVAARVLDYADAMERYQLQDAIAAVSAIVDRCNAHVEETAPWKLAKDPARADELDAVLHGLCEALRILSILLAPIIPREAAAMRGQLNLGEGTTWSDTAWGGLPDGHVLGKPSPLFPRIEQET
jgi:methionyl-tRNA synthetase